MTHFKFNRLSMGFILIFTVFRSNGNFLADTTSRLQFLEKYSVMRNEFASLHSKKLKCMTKCIVRELTQFYIDLKQPSGILEYTTILPVATTQKNIKKPVQPYMPFINQGMAFQGLKDCGRDKCKLGEAKQSDIEDKLNETFESLKICNNKMYYLTKASVEITKRTKVCCDFNYLPAQIESREELDCIRSYYNKIEGNGKAVKAFTAYWDTTLTRKFESCASRKVMPQELWAEGQPDNVGGIEMCTAVNLCSDCSYAGIQDVACVVPIPVLCYKNVTAGQTKVPSVSKKTVPAYDLMVQNALRFSGAYNCSGKITSCTMKTVSEQTFNKQATVLKQCGHKLFYMTTAKNAPTPNNNQMCCSINLWPAEFDTKDELNCLMEHYKNVTKKPVDLEVRTAYFDTTFTRKFESCITRRLVPDEFWAVNEPDNKLGIEYCVVLKLCTTCKNPGLYDTDCSSPRNMLCYKNLKSERELSSNQTTTSIPKIIPTYEPYAQKVMVSSGFYNCSGKGYECKLNKVTREEILKKFQSLEECNKKSYYISKFQIAAKDGIIKYCCNYNMFPAEIENRNEVECLQKNYLNISKNEKELFSFTVFLDTMFTRKFESCLTRRVMSDELWAPREPNNGDGVEYCTALKLCRKCKNSGIHDFPCSFPQYVLCYSKQDEIKEQTTTVSPRKKTFYNALVLQGLLLQKIQNCTGQDAKCIKKTVSLETLEQNMEFLGVCGQKSYYVTKKVTKRSYHACCNFNLQPAEFDSKMEMDCVRRFYKSTPGEGSGVKLYTAYWDATFTRKFESCLTRRTMPDELWSKDEPNNKLNVEYCAVLRPCASCDYAGFDDVECTEMLPMLCQK